MMAKSKLIENVAPNINRPFPDNGLPRGAIILWKGHHENSYYYAKNYDELAKVCLHVLNEQARYCDLTEEKFEESESSKLTPEYIATLPSKKLQDAATEEMEHYQSTKATHEKYNRQVEYIRKALAEKNGKMAFTALTHYFAQLDGIRLIEPLEYAQ